MKSPIFVDTSFFLALLNSRDQYHHAATEVAKNLFVPQVTSDVVLMELANALAKPPVRALAVRALREIRANREIEIIPFDRKLFDEAFALYCQRPDTAWGMADCTSFIIMRQRSLTQVLTADRHFEQAGFMRLLPTL